MNKLERYLTNEPKFKPAKMNKEQREALKAYKLAEQREDNYLGSVFVTRQGSEQYQQRTKSAYELCKRLGLGIEHGL